MWAKFCLDKISLNGVCYLQKSVNIQGIKQGMAIPMAVPPSRKAGIHKGQLPLARGLGCPLKDIFIWNIKQRSAQRAESAENLSIHRDLFRKHKNKVYYEYCGMMSARLWSWTEHSKQPLNTKDVGTIAPIAVGVWWSAQCVFAKMAEKQNDAPTAGNW